MAKFDLQKGYFRHKGVNIMAFDDIYPEGHQSGVSIIMHGNRIATNGDLRFEQTPGQWQPVPKQNDRIIDETTITTKLSYPDKTRHLQGFNPMVYPDLELDYTVTVKAVENAVEVTLDLSREIPPNFIGKMAFNMELFPGALIGKPWIMDEQTGIFPEQPNAPLLVFENDYKNLAYNPMFADNIIAKPYAIGNRFTCTPNEPLNRFTIETMSKTPLKLYDGRMNHNNGWFVISSEIPANTTKNAVKWLITPNIVEDWQYPPVVQVSQVGYHVNQPKIAVIELFDETNEKGEKNDENKKSSQPQLYNLTENGFTEVFSAKAEEWGNFLRYKYLQFDFSEISEEGLYKVVYDTAETPVFRIARDIYDRGVWQPVLEYFLPVQMCHMRVMEKYRVWHDYCHHDDAKMAPINYNHFDGYVQGDSTLTKYAPGEVIPGVNVGGWHDAGDFDIRIESQSMEFYMLTLAYEEFNVNYDVTAIDQAAKTVEIHQPDGKNDILQQIEHGVLSVISAYNALGRFYRGIIENNLRQYVILGDSSAVTDGITGNEDDRWLFTEENPARELSAAAHLAAAARALTGFNDTLAQQSLHAACETYKIYDFSATATNLTTAEKLAKLNAAAELFLTTQQESYKQHLLAEVDFITENISNTAWFIARVDKKLNSSPFSQALQGALQTLKQQFDQQSAETPYGIPYRPHIWGAGWNIQKLGCQYYFLHKEYPEIFAPNLVFNALNFVLGCHPGANTMSFASGVGAKSATVGYGLNRADWSYIPGGVISGTALIRPDFPELLVFPYLWQQVEYVIGGGSSNYMFLVLAAQKILKKSQKL
ncbi:MAG: glycoside hydrolase family 9 protein [Defluviitaleaceae bacterium]|nr:glycoside hydrolase family 9 protein [Defluviitaleaceae bacterium]